MGDLASAFGLLGPAALLVSTAPVPLARRAPKALGHQAAGQL
ncbi:hypothetical protein [Streptomyces sp. NPDC086182]